MLQHPQITILSPIRGCHLVSTPVGIAEESDKCKLSVHTHGLMVHTALFLQNPVDFLPRVPFPIGDTVGRHLECYGLEEKSTLIGRNS